SQLEAIRPCLSYFGDTCLSALIEQLRIVPRLNLQKQAEENFEDWYFRHLLGHQHRIMANNNEPNPCKGMSGYAATY
ncbi:hypothetical protein QUA30_06865, partial [Microcoleus sp. Pol14C2]|uniref:hypothetical protein n=1 Tax=unclassified Microcoleus TaxID=2642155 RepID=UPI002FD19227